MKSIITGLLLSGVFVVAGCWRTTQKSASAGPNGGDLVPIMGGNAYAEFLANADTGEAMVHTWDKDLKTRRPIEKEPISLGSGDKNVELTPHPMDTDPTGKSSRFYGVAQWMRGGAIRHGWIHGQSAGGHTEFDWSRCWEAGQAHGRMWEEMGKHRHMGLGHRPGHQSSGTDK